MIVAAPFGFGTFHTKAREEADRFSRLDLTDFPRERMRELCVAVAGLGALGSEAVRCLGLLGTGRIILVDFDSVESGNLPSSILLGGPNTIGRKKSTIISEWIGRYFPHTEPVELCREIADT